MAGAGTHLHALIKQWTGQEITASCSCEKWIRGMDRHGPAWCRKHCNEIVEKLMREAHQRAMDWRAVPVDNTGGMLRAARNRAWKGAFWIPGIGMALRAFVHRMVDNAITMAERNE